jgi:hypothetical protein
MVGDDEYFRLAQRRFRNRTVFRDRLERFNRAIDPH